MNANEYMKRLIGLEEENHLYEVNYKGFPIYRILRYFIRPAWISYIDKAFSVDNRHEKPSKDVTIKNVIYSLYDFGRIIINNRKFDNIFFPSFRMQEINGRYLDKFTDPVVIQSDISRSHSAAIFSISFYDNYRKKRINKKLFFQFEWVFILSYLFALVYLPFFKLSSSRKEIDTLLNNVKKIFSDNVDFSKKSYIEYMMFVFQYKIYKFILKRTHCKKIFFVIRANNYPQILAAHSMGIPAYEIQHGVTYGETVLYSGSYDAISDPEYFLIFGSMWKGPQFGVPIEKLINIGFAYKDYIKDIYSKKIEDAVLVISSPEITEAMVNMTSVLAQNYPKVSFYFRPHPHEGLTQEQLALLKGKRNIFFSDKSVDSNIEVMKYNKVIGTNSSVLFEAISLGVDVGRVNFGGLTVERYPGDEGFFYINNIEDFGKFLTNTSRMEIEAYSDFDKEKFLSIINN